MDKLRYAFRWNEEPVKIILPEAMEWRWQQAAADLLNRKGKAPDREYPKIAHGGDDIASDPILLAAINKASKVLIVAFSEYFQAESRSEREKEAAFRENERCLANVLVGFKKPFYGLNKSELLEILEGMDDATTKRIFGDIEKHEVLDIVNSTSLGSAQKVLERFQEKGVKDTLKHLNPEDKVDNIHHTLNGLSANLSWKLTKAILKRSVQTVYGKFHSVADKLSERNSDEVGIS